MIVAVTGVGMMQVSPYKIIKVIPVRHLFMSTGRTVTVPVIVPFAVMIWCAITWIEFAYRHEMFIHMVVMNVM